MAVDEQPVFRHDDHHAGGLDEIDLGNGAGKLALECTQIIGALHEVRDSEIGFVKDLEADAFAAGDAFGGELGTHRVDLVARHHDGGAAAAGAIGDLGVVEGAHDAGGFGVIELAVKQDVIEAIGPKGESDETGKDGDGGDDDGDALVQTQLFRGLMKLSDELFKILIQEIWGFWI